jgi:hypothetical protein
VKFKLLTMPVAPHIRTNGSQRSSSGSHWPNAMRSRYGEVYTFRHAASTTPINCEKVEAKLAR